MKYLIYLTLIAGLFASCNEENDFAAGPEPANTLGCAWFSGSYKSSYYYYDQPKEEDSIYIYVERADTAEALDLPIISTADPEVIIPSSVHFAAGDSESYLAIASPNLQISKSAQFSLQIPTEYANPYVEKAGTTVLTSSILWSEWTPVADTVLIISAYNYFPRQGCKLENFMGDNVFRFTDFLGSGNPLVFSLSNKLNTDDLSQNSGSMTPLTHAYYGSSYSDKIWDWSNDGGWTPFTPKGATFEISYPEFGWGHYYYPNTPYDNFDFSVSDADTIRLQKTLYEYDTNYWSKNVQMVYFYSPTHSCWDYLYFMICYKKK